MSEVSGKYRKFYVSKRLGALIDVIRPDGCIVTTEGFGNNHIDFASHIEQIGSLGVPVVGVSYCGVQGALVVGNKYMDAMVDLCVSEDGNVEDILAKKFTDSGSCIPRSCNAEK